MRAIHAVAEDLNLQDHIVGWGRDRAKLALEALQPGGKRGKLVLVSAINPTPAGEGKTTMSISLAMGLRQRGKKVIAALREPSLGPVFGVKGGGTGGGLATLEPEDAINLHFTGDIHAVSSAHNFLAALIDNTIVYREPCEIEPRSVTWPRVLDMNDRTLRKMIIGLGGKGFGVPREARFDITAASEVMAILCLATDLTDLQTRCARIVVGQTRGGANVTAGELGAGGAMAALLKDALMPNLVQTREGGPAIVHGGPFANIAHGCNSRLATEMALQHGEICVTEAGFGFDLGGEKFFDIKCRAAGLWPDAVVLTATLRALKYQGGASDPQARDDVALVRGLQMLDKHLQSIAFFGVPAMVVVNRFPDDNKDELSAVEKFVAERRAGFATCEGFAKGGQGALDFADRVLSLLQTAPAKEPHFVYSTEAPLREKLSAIARTIYGAREVVLTREAEEDLQRIGDVPLPICVAKTHLSLSDDARKRGRPEAFDITVRELRHAAGAGFIVALAGDIVTMPGLPKVPSARRVAIQADGRISGLMQK